jgi:hypothetical protein
MPANWGHTMFILPIGVSEVRVSVSEHQSAHSRGDISVTVRLGDTEHERWVEIDGQNKGCPNSVFIASSGGFCIEVDRAAFIMAIAQEFGGIPSTMTVEEALEDLLRTEAA